MDAALSTPATSASVNRKNLNPPLQSAKYHCPAPSYTKVFRRIQHINRHIRDQKDDAYKKLASVIAAKRYTSCNKEFPRPIDFAKHQRIAYSETNELRLYKVLIIARLPTPPPEASGISDHTSRRRARRHFIPMFPLIPSSDGTHHSDLYKPLPALEPTHVSR